MKKLLRAGIALLLVCLLLAGCGKKLPESFDKDETLAAAKATVAQLSERDYAGVAKDVRADLQSTLSAEVLQGVFDPVFDKLGAFTEIRDVGLYGAADSKTGEEYAVAIVAAKYENGTAAFTISYDKDFQIVGLYVK